MTDREKAIVMAYTGYCMLAGDKLKVFYEYVGELLGRPVYTHEFADPDIQEKASDDFYKLCRETTPEDMDDLQKDADYWHKLSQSYAHTICTMSKAIAEHSEKQWIPCSERLPNTNGCYLVWRPHFFGGEIGMPSICYFDGQNTWHDSYGVDFERVLSSDDVTAWMPLPEPWREEKVEGEPIPQWRGCMDECLPYYDGKEVKQ